MKKTIKTLKTVNTKIQDKNIYDSDDGIFLCILPLPPSVNRVWQVAHNRIILTQEGRVYRERVIKIIKEKKDNNNKLNFKHLLHLKVEIYPPDKRRRDADNILKSLLDALQHAELYENDSQIKELNVIMYDKIIDKGCVIIRLYDFEPKPEPKINELLLTSFKKYFSVYPDE